MSGVVRPGRGLRRGGVGAGGNRGVRGVRGRVQHAARPGCLRAVRGVAGESAIRLRDLRGDGRRVPERLHCVFAAVDVGRRDVAVAHVRFGAGGGVGSVGQSGVPHRFSALGVGKFPGGFSGGHDPMASWKHDSLRSGRGSEGETMADGVVPEAGGDGARVGMERRVPDGAVRTRAGKASGRSGFFGERHADAGANGRANAAGAVRGRERHGTDASGSDVGDADGYAVFPRECGNVVSLRRGRAGGACRVASGLFKAALPGKLPGGVGVRGEN